MKVTQLCDFVFYWQVQKDLAKLRLKSKLWEDGGYDIFFPAKIIALTFLAASLSSAVTSGLHFKNAPNSIYCLIPGHITQQNAIASVKHICIARVNSPGKQAHLLQKSEWGVGRALLFWQAEGASAGKLPHLSLSMELTLSPCFRHQPLPLASPSAGVGLGLLSVVD